MAASLLLVGMIAAIALTLRHRKDSKAITGSLQVRVKAKDRVTVIKMDATKPAITVLKADELSVENKV